MRGVIGEHLRSLLDALPEGGLLMDADGVVLRCSRVTAARLGGTPGSLEGLRFADLTTDGAPTLGDALQAALRSSGDVRLRVQLPAPSPGQAGDLALRLRAVRREDDGALLAILVSVQAHVEAVQRFLALNERLANVEREVSRRQRAEEALSEQLEWRRVVMNSIADAVLTTDRRGMVTWMNPVAERLTGWTLTQALGLPLPSVFRIVNEHTREPVTDPVQLCLAQGRVVGLANHTVLISRDGREYGIEDSAAPIRSEGGELHGVVLVFHDVTEQRKLAGEISYRASHDGLTGTINRAEFERRLAERLAACRASGGCDSLLFIDLDQFKLVNDSAGHAVGDRLLRQLARLIESCLPGEHALLARIGGDEFAVLIENDALALAQEAAQRICDEVGAFRFVHGERRFHVGASVGLIPVDRRWPNEASLMQAADNACYAAKQEGGNRVRQWADDDESLRALQGAAQWVQRIEEAIEDNRFVLYAQPIVPAHGRSPGLHAEVLLRMLDGEGGLVFPAAFLPAAERFHLAPLIDRWVLSRVIQWLFDQQARLDAIELLAVNLSGQSLGDRSFQRLALDLLAGLPRNMRQRLCLEITETAALTNLSEASAFVDEVRALDVRVALDDFGAGASSFSYLKRLRVDFLKIDGQYVRGLLTDPLDEATVRCFIDVARSVGVGTVAEFVEDEATRARLLELGVGYLQGYLIDRPAPLAEMESRLRPAGDRQASAVSSSPPA